MLAAKITHDIGHNVLEAENASEALQTIRRLTGALHVIRTDAVMPGVAGPKNRCGG